MQTTVDELLTRAFELAYFILGDRTIAIYVSMSAVDKLKIASTAQDRRFDYTPVGRFTHPAIRTKIRLSEPHLLQRLVYAESEPFERLLEGQRRSVQEDLIVRFVKHLVRITIKHNSFYLSLGLCRLLYNYTTNDTTQIYDFLIQDPERTKDDYYYRSRKQHLIREMKQRFGDSLQTYRGPRGEERFQARKDSVRYQWLVEECLRRFTPWWSDCILPPVIDHHRNVIAPLLFEGENPDEEHQIEINRIHTLLHPPCFARIVDSLGLDAAADRLELPQFAGYEDHQRNSDDRFKPGPLNYDEVDAVKRYLDRNNVSRKSIAENIFSLQIDGAEWARFSLEDAPLSKFGVPEEAESIGVSSFESDDSIPLAIHMLARDASAIRPSAFSVTCNAGPILNFKISSTKSAEPGTVLTVDRSQSKGLALWFDHKLRSLEAWKFGSTLWTPTAAMRLGLAAILLALALEGLWTYIRYRERSIDTRLVAKQDQPEQPIAPPSTQPTTPQQSTQPPAGNNEGKSEQHSDKRSSSNPTDSGDTRRAEWASDPAELLTVKRVYVDQLGDTAISRGVRDSLIRQLQSSDRLQVVQNRDDADAVFKGVVRSERNTGTVSLALRLVNTEGKVVWPLPRSSTGRAYVGSPDEISIKSLNSLLSDIARLEQKR
jgi:hypothetical protein